MWASQKKKQTEEKAKVVAAVCGTYLNDAITIYEQQGRFEVKFLSKKPIHFGRVVVWCGVNQMIIHFSEASILPSVFSSIHPFLQIILLLNL